MNEAAELLAGMPSDPDAVLVIALRDGQMTIGWFGMDQTEAVDVLAYAGKKANEHDERPARLN